jgi:C_GCAxxG_C_C family probable redox protein
LSACTFNQIMNPEAEAKRLSDSGYNCAESVLLAMSQKTRHSTEAIIPRIATGFGGGISRNGDVCGALTGAVMGIGLAAGRDSSEESRDPCYAVADRFYSAFIKEFGTCKCHELTGVDLKTEKGRETQARIHSEHCTKIVSWATRVACQMIESR